MKKIKHRLYHAEIFLPGKKLKTVSCRFIVHGELVNAQALGDGHALIYTEIVPWAKKKQKK